jgi:hypothetical protein
MIDHLPVVWPVEYQLSIEGEIARENAANAHVPVSEQ